MDRVVSGRSARSQAYSYALTILNEGGVSRACFCCVPGLNKRTVSPAVPHRTLTVLLVFALAVVTVPARAESSSAAPGQVEALEKVLHTLLAGHADSPVRCRAISSPGQCLLDLGDAYTDKNQHRRSYEQGAKVARRALHLGAL